MKRFLFTVFVLVFVFGIAFAGSERCGEKKSASAHKSEYCGKKAEAQASAATSLSDEEAKEKTKHVCPDVSGKTRLNEFHEAMHPMHVAVMDEDFEELRKCLPNLLKASEAVADYKCHGYEKCSEACKKNFDGKKAELIEAVDHLSEACKGKDTEKITANFDIMHEAYITFANVCVHPEKAKLEKEKVE